MPSPTPFLSFILLLFLFSPPSISVVAGGGNSGESNPFTAKAHAIRYWKTQISNGLPKPWFLLNKASPMSAAQYARFSKLAADPEALAAQLAGFCSSGNLLCFPDMSPSLEKHNADVSFAKYGAKNFTNYGSGRAGGVDSFKNYSDSENMPVNSFRRYSRGAAGHSEGFSRYATGGNVIEQRFNTYGASATGGEGVFSSYAQDVNDPNEQFTSYSDNANGRKQDFRSYADNANAGDQGFQNYAKNSNGAENSFGSYGTDANVVGSTFSNYGQAANVDNETFTNYGFNGNNPQNNFKTYGAGSNAGLDSFHNYRDQANVGGDSFQSYRKGSSSAESEFVNYGKSFNVGTEKFSGYGARKTGFAVYGVNNTFKEYERKEAVGFSSYTNASSQSTAARAAAEGSGKKVINHWVEPGKFFREKMLKNGTVMPMPDIRDKMPQRSFLPRAIAAKLPFSAAKIGDLKRLFHAADGSAMEKILADTLAECERAPSRGETKRCVTSVEDMIDFSTSVLGRNVVVRTTENTEGSKRDIMVNSVKGINGGKVTRSVSCHQSLYPSLVYYCHSVPKVRVYEADILDPNTRSKINHAVAICHIDTSSWSPTHGAFLALGSGPGKIEVCHWIFENDMTWAVAD
ncbi:unnamed protein product [Cuscuta campestris]|uniref:BURP domain-containing protein n=2 Tax=Cuscuta campestris TaxID=132261 RepID=A0A484MI26_9ASTE|nr:unnamed protein product [Cuscuta campestris]